MTVTKTEQNILTARRNRIRALVASAGSRIHSVHAVLKSGENRVFTCQNAIAPFRVAGESASDSAKQGVATRARNNPHLMNSFEINKNDFRSINLDTVYAVKIDGIVYDIAPHAEQ